MTSNYHLNWDLVISATGDEREGQERILLQVCDFEYNARMFIKQRPIFHLAFPVKSVGSTLIFYRDQLGLRIDLIEKDRCIIDFFGHQAVAHVSAKDVPDRVSLYPRHFGVILDDERQFDEFHQRLQRLAIPFFERLFVRFAGTPREHKTFFLKDPSNNLIEFKWYRDASLIFKSDPQSPPLNKD